MKYLKTFELFERTFRGLGKDIDDKSTAYVTKWDEDWDYPKAFESSEMGKPKFKKGDRYIMVKK